MNKFGSPDQLTMNLPGTQRLTLEVAASEAITPQMRRIRLRSPALQEFAYSPGQDIMLWVSAGGERMVYRRYTIRSLDRAAGHLDLEVVMHAGEGPGLRWATTAKPGDLVEAVGPRGKITIVPAASYVFAGDESFLPAAFAMLEALPAGTPAWAFLEVANAEEEQPLAVSADLRLGWVHRDNTPPGEASALVTALSTARLPTDGHAYVAGELQVAAALRRALERGGFEASHISSKAYWGRGRANAGHGEPNREE